MAAQALPSSEAETLAGQKVRFPDFLAGKSAVCVFTFSREAGESARAWMDPLWKAGVDAYSIANIEAAPRLVRGMIRRGMKSGMPPDYHARSLVLTRDEKAWKAVLQATDDKWPVVVRWDASGKITARYTGPFDARALERFTRQ
ncbi:MAG: hypothetical protein K2X35_16660 [Bryobacteraceae bacterium]|nr:hypothetical protein [Bryobacteraceae bacterium]